MANYNGGPGVDLFLGGSDADVVTNIGQGADVIATDGGNDTVSVIPGSDLLGLAALVEMGEGNDDHLIVQYGGSDTAFTMSPLTLQLGLGFSGSLTGTGQSGLTFSGVDRFTINGSQFADVMNTGNAADQLFGNGGDDTMDAGEGGDLLDGGTGADAMTGGSGDDTYFVDDPGDTTDESAGSGTDTVRSSVALTLADGIEHLVLEGSLAINGTGNSGANTITGNSNANTISGEGDNDALTAFGGADILDGGTGADVMAGGSGDDTYVVDNAGDIANEASASGIDLVQSSVSFTLGAGVDNLILTGAGAIDGTGNSGANSISGTSAANILSGGGANDLLTGFGGNDRLDGGAGNDAMVGGAGDDTYVVDINTDQTDETGGSGTDLVLSSVGFVLSTGVENLMLTGTAALNGTGNAGVNAITGNSGANILSGLGGNDTLAGFGGNDQLNGGTDADSMAGGNGNDTYAVDNVGDTVSEGSGTGVDVVFSTAASFTLAAGVENLVLSGTEAIDGTGSSGDNLIFGNPAANRIEGDGGSDTLTGFGGADAFVFDDGDGADTIADFANGLDTFDLTAVAPVDDFSDLTVVDNGATVTVSYGTGSFTLANIGNAALVDASDFVFA